MGSTHFYGTIVISHEAEKNIEESRVSRKRKASVWTGPKNGVDLNVSCLGELLLCRNKSNGIVIRLCHHRVKCDALFTAHQTTVEQIRLTPAGCVSQYVRDNWDNWSSQHLGQRVSGIKWRHDVILRHDIVTLYLCTEPVTLILQFDRQ